MKGQVYLLTAAIIIGILVTLRGFATIQQISSEREVLDISTEDLAFRNMDNEARKLTSFFANSPGNMTDISIDFLNFTRVGNSGHSQDFRSLFVGVLANSTNQTMNVTVFQFLRENNLNVTIRLNTSTEQTNTTLLNDTAIWISNFTFTAGQTYNLTVILPDKSYQENITVSTKTNKDTYTGYFDLRLVSERADHVSKFQQGVKAS